MRTDIHRPSVIVPADYRFVEYEYLGPDDPECLIARREYIAHHMSVTGGTYSSHAHGGNCHVCGAHCMYTALFHHVPTNVYVRTGLDCASNFAIDSGEGEMFRRQVRDALDAIAGKRKARALFDEAGIPAASGYIDCPYRTELTEPILDDDGEWTGRHTHVDYHVKREAQTHNTIRDIVHSVVKYGNLSEAKAKYLRHLLNYLTNELPAKVAKYEAKQAARLDVPTGKLTVTGKVVSIKWKDGYTRWDPQVKKAVIESADGWRVYGTVPAALLDCVKGDVVEFNATVERSDDDRHFGFYKRPTKPKFVQRVSVETTDEDGFRASTESAAS